MDISFSSGTAEQRRLFQAALDDLLHLDLDRFPIAWTISFESDPDPSQHNEFAFTQASGTLQAETAVRRDAPNFQSLGDRWSMPFFNEIAAHELCHVLLGFLPSDAQDQIAAMFGATPDNWNPLGRPWVDRPLEGICETFKDAFLPQGLRRYSNRTNQTIPISKYPAFRAKFREAMTLASASSFDFILPNDIDAYGPSPGSYLQDLRTGIIPADEFDPDSWASASGYPQPGSEVVSPVATNDELSWRIRRTPIPDPFEDIVYRIQFQHDLLIEWEGGATQQLRVLSDDPGNLGPDFTVFGWPLAGLYPEGVTPIVESDRIGVDFVIPHGPSGETSGTLTTSFRLFVNLSGVVPSPPAPLDPDALTAAVRDLFQGTAEAAVAGQDIASGEVVPGGMKRGQRHSPRPVAGHRIGA